MDKRLFFGFELQAPWPDNFPRGRLLSEESRHLTLAFLGEVESAPLLELLPALPKPPFPYGSSALFDVPLFLPPRRPRCAAWHLSRIEPALLDYQEKLSAFLAEHGYSIDRERAFLPHATLCRAPFSRSEWENFFRPLPVCIGTLHLYESLGSSRYRPCWSHPLLPPFEEMEHAADIAYLIRGGSFPQLFANAQTALAFSYPELTPFLSAEPAASLDQLIAALNRLVAEADKAVGSPIKAVSYHSKLIETDYYTWEMIVDV